LSSSRPGGLSGPSAITWISSSTPDRSAGSLASWPRRHPRARREVGARAVMVTSDRDATQRRTNQLMVPPVATRASTESERAAAYRRGPRPRVRRGWRGALTRLGGDRRCEARTLDLGHIVDAGLAG